MSQEIIQDYEMYWVCCCNAKGEKLSEYAKHLQEKHKK